MALLDLVDVSVSYGGAIALSSVSLTVESGSGLTIIGPNGAGKSTLLKAISRLVKSTGSVRFRGQEIGTDPVNVVRSGLIHCPERRRLFPDMTVAENLNLGAYCVKDRARIRSQRDWVLDVMPKLADRARQQAGTLSGGEQQMLAIARALMSHPRVLLLDEPSQGLAQIIKDDIVRIVRMIQDRGVAVITVEQDTGFAMELTEDVMILEGGRCTFDGTWGQVRGTPALHESYFGMS